MDDIGPRAYGIAEVCRRTGLGRTSVYAVIKDGALVARKIGRRTIVLDDDLKVFLSNLRPIFYSSSLGD